MLVSAEGHDIVLVLHTGLHFILIIKLYVHLNILYVCSGKLN